MISPCEAVRGASEAKVFSFPGLPVPHSLFSLEQGTETKSHLPQGKWWKPEFLFPKDIQEASKGPSILPLLFCVPVDHQKLRPLGQRGPDLHPQGRNATTEWPETSRQTILANSPPQSISHCSNIVFAHSLFYRAVGAASNLMHKNG